MEKLKGRVRMPARCGEKGAGIGLGYPVQGSGI
jgi:hypothetical protein